MDPSKAITFSLRPPPYSFVCVSVSVFLCECFWPWRTKLKAILWFPHNTISAWEACARDSPWVYSLLGYSPGCIQDLENLENLENFENGQSNLENLEKLTFCPRRPWKPWKKGVEFQHLPQTSWVWVSSKLDILGASRGKEFQNFLQPWWRWVSAKLFILGAYRGMEIQYFFNHGEDE